MASSVALDRSCFGGLTRFLRRGVGTDAFTPEREDNTSVGSARAGLWLTGMKAASRFRAILKPSARARRDRPLGSTGLTSPASVLPALAASLVALRYVVLGPHGVSLLGVLDGLFIRAGRDTHGFFQEFAANEEPKYEAHAALLLVHVTAMSMALGVGALQVLISMRRRFRALHRTLGWAYTGSALLGLPAGAFIALELPMIGSYPAVIP